jgi:hypothetical protein
VPLAFAKQGLQHLGKLAKLMNHCIMSSRLLPQRVDMSLDAAQRRNSSLNIKQKDDRRLASKHRASSRLTMTDPILCLAHWMVPQQSTQPSPVGAMPQVSLHSNSLRQSPHIPQNTNLPLAYTTTDGPWRDLSSKQSVGKHHQAGGEQYLMQLHMQPVRIWLE